MPEFQPKPAPTPQIPVIVHEPASKPDTHLVQDPTQSATVGTVNLAVGRLARCG